jgi:BRCA1 C Terminus (BRCT) domain
LVVQCEDAGAKVTAQVHKNVFCVIVTDTAIKYPTQRIRKAWKRGVPVVHYSWMQRCVGSKELLSFQEIDLISEPIPRKNDKKERRG